MTSLKSVIVMYDSFYFYTRIIRISYSFGCNDIHYYFILRTILRVYNKLLTIRMH